MKHNLKKCLSLFLAILMIMTSWVFVAPSTVLAASTKTQVETAISNWKNGLLIGQAKRAADNSYTASGLKGEDQMLNVLWAYGVGGNSGYTTRANKDYWGGGLQYGDITLLYDGINDIGAPVNLFHTSYKGSLWQNYDMSPASYYCDDSILELRHLWHGTSKSVGYQTSTSNHVNITNDQTPAGPATLKDGNTNYYSNTIYVKKDAKLNFTNHLISIKATWNISTRDNGKASTNAKHKATITVGDNQTIRILDYSTVAAAIPSVVDFYNNNIKDKENRYDPTSLGEYYDAVCAVLFNTNSSFDTSSTSGNNYSDCINKIVNAENNITKAKTLPEPRTLTYTYDGNGGTVNVASYTSKYGYETKNIPTSGSRLGYEFIAMYADAKTDNTSITKPVVGEGDYNNQLLLDRIMKDDQTWYAAWWLKNIDVKFVNENNEVLVDLTKKYGSVLNESEIPEGPEYKNKPGNESTFTYEFDHWEIVEAKKYSSETDDTQIEDTSLYGEGVTSTMFGDIVFAPVYSPLKNSYIIKFCDENGQDLLINSYSYNDLVVQPADLDDYEDNTYTYTFKGWKESKYEVEKEIIDAGTPTAASLTVSKVKHDTIYIPVFERTYKEYTVTFKNQDPKYGDYTYTGHYNDTYEVPAHADNYTLNGYRNTFIKWNETTSTHSALGKLTANAEFVAEYETTPAIYSIKFVDYDGSIIEEKEYAHGSAVVIPEATQTYRDDDYEYTFDKFVDEEGISVSNIAGKDATYKATYTSNKLYIVNFFNGSEFLDSVKVVAGNQIPNYTGENPVKPDDNYAKNYIFQGFETTEGDRLEDILMPEGNLNLFAKFDGTIINYVVKFMNDDEVVSETYYSYGEKVEIPENPSKDIDETYIYDFRGWDKEIETVCHGNMTYNAIYRKSYVYYPITWVNDDGSIIKTQKYIYNERLSAPDTDKLVSANMVPSSPAMTVVFKEWQYEDGTTYKRGDKVTSSVTLKAVYQETGKDCTVTFVNYDGTQLKKFNVAYDTKLENIDYPIPVKISTANKHYSFSGWLADNEISKDRVLGDVVYTAQFTEEEHVYKLKEVITKPTFDTEGSAIWACDCEFSEVRTVDALTDNVAPSAFIIIGKNEWKDVADASFDVQTPVAGNNYFAITTSDTADVNETYNKNGAIGSGVDTISYLIWDKGGYVDPATLDESAWTPAWSYTEVYEKAKESYTQDAEGNLSPRDQAELDAKMAKLQANATGTLDQLLSAEMVEGQDFVLVVRVIDKKSNVIYANTGVLCYDNVAPQIEISSAYNNGVKHCIDVSISVTDDSNIESVKVDGKDISAEADGSYRYTAPGLHQVVVTDVAGNNTKVNFEIIGKHVAKNIVKTATCTENGYSKEVCTICGITTKEVEEITSPGHNSVIKTTEATCTEDEVKTTYCTICLETLNVETVEDTALGHEWAEHYTKTPDCSHTGIYEEICNRCNETQSTVLEKNENVHTWYPPVTVKATCNQEGYKERTCKYCGKSEVLETYDKLNHVAGEWIVDVDPTCTTDGHKVAFCANCKSTDVVAEEVIPATGHSIVATIVPPTKDTQGYTKYECSKCDFVEIKDYTEKLDEYTVTFVVEGAETNVSKLNGETISSDDSCIPEAEKAEDNSNTYFFAGWKNADGEMVQFPITVTSDLTLTAVFTSRAKNYSVKLLNYDGTVFYKVGYNHYNEIVDLSSYKPIKPADDTNTYMFTGWKKQGADDSTKSMSVKIDTTDEIVLEPVFAAMVKEFNVVFAFDNYDVIKTYKNVKAGEDVVFDGETPLKQYIDGEHYNFVGWIGADETGTVKNVRNDVLVIAKFESEVHNTSNGIVIQSVSCTQPEITEYVCSCGYKFNRETIPAWGHNWSTVPEDRDGVHGFSCTNPGCGEFKEDTTTYTVTFVDDDKVTVLKTIAYLKWGETIDIPESPKKDDTTYSSFMFTGWTDAEGNAVDVETVIKSNATYYASYKKTEKIYTVVYAIDAEHVCAVYNVKGGDFVEYKGEIPVSYNPDAYGHREFDEWSEGGYTGTIDNVTSNMYIIAKFEKYDHSYNNKKIAATCTKPGGIEHTCIICNYSYLEKTAGELGHKWEIQKTEGLKVTYKCSNCGEFREELLPDTSVIADIYVTDANGNPLTGAVVTIIDGNNQVNKGTTVSGGHLKLKVPKAKTYSIIVEYDRYNSAGEIVVNPDGSTVISDVQIQLKACSCPCHKVGAWGDIFRFFHKIIKLITGKYSCCEDPDRRYSK